MMDRRWFLRLIAGGAAGVVAAPIIKPRSFFSFFGLGELWKPSGPVLAESTLTLMDIVKRMPQPPLANIAEYLNQPNDLFKDMYWLPEIEPVTRKTVC